ncbi:MAG: QueT transporter family protein [Eubacteriales bacterium]|nr:QueT transporter family protein [Eubacteriales bacterium]
MSKTKYLTQAAIIAALYIALTFVPYLLSYGLLQIRISEALTVLPAFTPAAIPGLFVGCLISNLLGPNGTIDVLAGSAATLLAAILSRRIKNKWLVPFPPVLINAVVVGYVLNQVYNEPLLIAMLAIFAGQAVACYGLGIPLYILLDRNRNKIF